MMKPWRVDLEPLDFNLWKKCFRNLDFLIWMSMVSIHTMQDIQDIPVEQNQK